MTKDEITKALMPFGDNTEILVTDGEGMQVDIKHFDYHLNNGIGEVTIVPMGSHLPKDEVWVRITDK